MKAIVIIFTIVLSLCSEIRAQAFTTDNDFVVNYPFHLGANVVYGIIEESDSSFLLYGQITNLGGSYPHYIVKFNHNGNVNMNFQTFPIISFPIEYAKKTSYGYFVTGFGEKVRKIDANTASLVDSTYFYNQDFNNPATCGTVMAGTSLLETGDSIYWGGDNGSTPACSYILFRLNSNAFLDTTFTKDVNGTVGCIKEYNDSLLIISGYFSQYGGLPVNRIMRIHQNGDLDTTFQSILTWGEGTVSHIDNLGRIIFVGGFKIQGSNDTLSIIRLMPDGTLDSTFNNSAIINQTAQFAGPVCPTTDGGYLIGGDFSMYDGYNRSCIVKTDANGFIDTTYFNGPGFDYLSTTNGLTPQVINIVPGMNDKYYIVGRFDTYNGDFAPFVVRLHGLSVSVDELESEKIDFEIYPNPANEKIKILLNKNKLNYSNLMIYNLYGALVMKKELNADNIEIDISELKNGLYFISIGSVNKKFIVQH